MKISIKATNLEIGQGLKDLIKEKVDSLEKFAKDIFGEKYWNHFFGKGRPRAEAFVEVAKTTYHHKSGPFFYAELQIRFPGYSLRSEATRENLEIALNEAKEEIKRQIKEFRGKLVAEYERGARVLKSEILLSKLAKKKRPKREWREGI